MSDGRGILQGAWGGTGAPGNAIPGKFGPAAPRLACPGPVGRLGRRVPGLAREVGARQRGCLRSAHQGLAKDRLGQVERRARGLGRPSDGNLCLTCAERPPLAMRTPGKRSVGAEAWHPDLRPHAHVGLRKLARPAARARPPACATGGSGPRSRTLHPSRPRAPRKAPSPPSCLHPRSGSWPCQARPSSCAGSLSKIWVSRSSSSQPNSSSSEPASAGPTPLAFARWQSQQLDLLDFLHILEIRDLALLGDFVRENVRFIQADRSLREENCPTECMNICKSSCRSMAFW
jgi:hypothetical protein